MIDTKDDYPFPIVVVVPVQFCICIIELHSPTVHFYEVLRNLNKMLLSIKNTKEIKGMSAI